MEDDSLTGIGITLFTIIILVLLGLGVKSCTTVINSYNIPMYEWKCTKSQITKKEPPEEYECIQYNKKEEREYVHPR